ncbi:sugar transferase [Desulfurivibrio alkaliphilus]|uniref:Exopolysaccharide biosynthesis polyprenyl glycosylphosphotransferase n=1 Tax=Desulfurivibrio alkaliphilus (strain DSM 19089 / UNIQEM U267 / AHT2) TaxID=589865 RepID=D6Z4J3_DESAT|nr:sugar transferase [Desulfurivibrio alkaliphilus]ADH86468.1 exopolysaccharide biosynthesis polyprenyl glycosylphosphotransferase [Desulfurivibrio alkaliphilus AHT 2]
MYDPRSKELDRTLFSLDVVCTVAAFLVAFWARNLLLPEAGQLNLYSHIFLLPLLLTLLILFLSYFGAYQNPRYATFMGYAWAIFRGMALTIGVLLSLLFFLEIDYVSRMVIIGFAGLGFVALVMVRAAMLAQFRQSLQDGSGALRVLIIGTGERARELARNLHEQAEWGIKIVGHLDPESQRIGSDINGVPVIGNIDQISQCLKSNVVDEVIIAIPRSLLEDAEHIAHACEEEGIKLRFMADIFNVQVARVSLAQVGNLPLLTMEPVAQDESKLFAKRVFDLTVTLLAMPLVLPLMAVVALAVKLDSPGPAIFVQQRVGLRKHLFPMFKFRSMYMDAEEKMKEIEHLNEAQGPIFKISNDPRVTRVGRFIRRTSLDELPQLFNVLRGEMSLVGPRPMSIRDVDLFDRGIQRKRFSVKPGVTCLWQISGRSDLPFEKWLALDLEYIDNWSLWMDIKILLKTVPAVLFSKGAV